MKEIPLTQGKVALVDDADYEAVGQFKWCAKKVNNTFYAVHSLSVGNGRQRTIRLHRLIMPGHPEIDHRDGDGLNNQRENLRPATHIQNMWGHRRKKAGVSSVYRGVSWHSQAKKWRSDLKLGGKTIYLGCFFSEIEAAKAYDVAARKYFGEFACPNFP